MQLSIRDGSNVIQLSPASGIYQGVTYVPQAPAMTANEIISQTRNGGSIGNVTRRNVTETCEIVLTGSSPDVLSAKQSIENVLQKAQFEQDIYLELQVRDGQPLMRSRILYGQLSDSPESMLRRYESATTTVILTATWTREWYWEDNTERQLAIRASGRQSNNVTVNLYNDTRYWADIGAANVQGAIPAPAIVTIKNVTGTSLAWRRFWVANNVFNNPTSFDAYIAGSEALSGATRSWGAGSPQQYKFSLNSSQVGAGNGDRFRLLAGFNSISGRTYVRGNVGNDSGSVSGLLVETATGNEVYSGDLGATELMDLGPFRIPSRRDTATAGVGIRLDLRSQLAGSSNLAFLALMPGNDVYFEQLGFSASNNGEVTYNGVEGVAYANNRTGLLSQPEGELLLWPNVDQRIYCFFDNSGYTAGLNTQIRVSYRPRRLTL